MAGAMLQGGSALEKLGHVVDYAFHEDLGPLPRSPRARRLISPLLVLQQVTRRIGAGRTYDLVEIHEPLAAAYSAARAVKPLPPCVVFSHGLEARAWIAQRERYRVQDRRPSVKSRISVPSTVLSQAHFALRRAAHVIVLNSDDENYLVEKVRVPPTRVSRVDNGAPPFGLPQPLRKTDVSALRLLFFGTWVDRKGTPELVEAVTALEELQVDFTLTVAGLGLQQREAARVALRFPPRVRRRVEIRSRVAKSELASLLAAHDILIAASWFEGMPLAVLESAAAGLALILTDISGHRQIIEAADEALRDRSAIFVPPNQAAGIVNAVHGLSKDFDLLFQLRVNAYRLGKRLDWENAASQLEKAYFQALSKSSSR